MATAVQTLHGRFPEEINLFFIKYYIRKYEGLMKRAITEVFPQKNRSTEIAIYEAPQGERHHEAVIPSERCVGTNPIADLTRLPDVLRQNKLSTAINLSDFIVNASAIRLVLIAYLSVI